MESLKSAALQTIRAKIPPITPKPASKATIKPIEETEAPPTMFAAPSPIITQTSQASLSPTHPNRQATITACDRAEFLGDITIPDGSILTPIFEFIKSWRVKNTGGCTWTNNYHLIYARGNPMNNKGSIPLQDTIAPGETAEGTAGRGGDRRGRPRSGGPAPDHGTPPRRRLPRCGNARHDGHGAHDPPA